MEVLAIPAGDAAVAMAHVFAQTDIRDHDQLRASSFDRSDGLLHDAVFRIRRCCLLIFLLRNAEEQDSLQPEIVGVLRFVGYFREPELENARHARDWLPRYHSLADKKRENEVVRAEFYLANEVSQAGALAQTARPMNQFSHRSRLSVTPRSRKLAAGRVRRTGGLDAVERSR